MKIKNKKLKNLTDRKEKNEQFSLHKALREISSTS
jgi:hypothetical protein